MVFDFTAPPGVNTDCTALRIKINSRFYAGYSIETRSATVNVTGNLQELFDDPANNALSLTMFVVNVTTDSGPVVLNNLHVESFFIPGSNPRVDPGPLPYAVNVRSNSGDVHVSGLLAPNPVIITGGEIRSSTLVSTSPLFGCFTGEVTNGAVPGICGNTYIESTGRGKKVVLSQLLGGLNVVIKSNGGQIIGANAAVIVGAMLDIASNGGNIILNGFVQAYGNYTRITSGGGSMSFTAYFGNYVYADTGDGPGKMSLTAVFMGLDSPGSAILPVQPNTTAPAWVGRTSRGDISIVSFGATPGDAVKAGALTVDLASQLGDIKVEVNGGGFAGTYPAGS